jgi:senataxin
MREEMEIVDELHGLDGFVHSLLNPHTVWLLTLIIYRELKSFPAEAHWFCPKRRDDDQIDYAHPDDAEEDMSSDTKRELIHDAKRRHDVAYKYSIILGLGPEDSAGLLDVWLDRLNHLLETCDKCGYNWHMGRKAYVKEISEYVSLLQDLHHLADLDRQFDEDIARELSTRLNNIDFNRINAGLEQAEKILARVEQYQRTQMAIASHSSKALLALFEALCCVDYHRDDDQLAKHFDYVFEQIQTRKVLRISDLLPAMTRFLFSTNPVRTAFATTAWQKTTTMLTPATFEWVVQDTLTEAMILVTQSIDTEEIKRFWSGFLLILDKMDETLIRHTLRGMEVQVDIWHLALQHLACNSVTTLPIVMKALHRLVQKAPKDFWSAMGTISPATVAEQIFQSPGFERLLLDSETFKDQSFETSPVSFWIADFLKSLPPIHQHDACRTLLVNLLERFQIERYPEPVRLACCRAGLAALHITLQTFTSSEYKINPTTSLIVINDIMGLVHKYGAIICGFADLVETAENIELRNVAMLVVREVLTLDCKAVSTEYSALQQQGAQIHRVSRNHSEAIWQSVLDVFRPGNVELAKSILPATLVLVGLDELYPVSKKAALKKDHAEFNKDFHKLMDSIARIFERLSDFEPQSLKKLYSDSATARPLVGALVSADEGVNQAAIELIKAMTGQDSKQDAIQDLLESNLNHVLSALTYAAVRIGKASSFGPVPFMIKLNRQVLKALCGNTGILRARSSFDGSEKRVVSGWWLGQWKVLDMVFKHTEEWATRVTQPTAAMQDFCRDGMEYAEALFNEYTVFASALTLSNIDDEENLGATKSSSTNQSLTNVLQVVCNHVYGLVGLLRLRDAYLVSVITSLLGKLLRCLGEYHLEVDSESAEFIKDACKREGEKNFKKTNLTGQQRAELQRALDEHQGVEIIEVPRPSAFPKKQASLDAWSKSADGKQHEPKLPAKSAGAFQLHSSAAEKQRLLLDRINAQKAMSEEQQNTFRENRRKAEEEKNRIKSEAIAKAKALRAPAGVRGEGSGLKDISGLIGKDHAPVRSEIMVGSSDDDSDDSDDEDGIPTLIRKKTSQRVSEYEDSRRRALLQQQQGPIKKTKIQRSAKDLRARVEPNMDNLYLEILSWDIFHPGDDPPSNNVCTRIDDKYLDLDKYKKTFAPLLISEIWRSLVTAKDENNFKPVEISVLNRMSVDKFMEINSTMPISANRDLKMSERDVVLLSKSPDPLANQQEMHCLARVNRTTRKKDVVELTFRISRDVPQKFLDSCFVPKAKVFAVKIADMTTTQREFAALSSLEYYDLCNEVLEARPSPLQKYSDEKTAQMSAKYKLNRGQLKLFSLRTIMMALH